MKKEQYASILACLSLDVRLRTRISLNHERQKGFSLTEESKNKS